MPDSTPLSHHPGTPVEDRFLGWVDELVDPATGIPPAPDADFRDIAGTANAIQWAAGPAGAPTLSTDRADAIWEDIMTTATVTPNPTPTLSGSGNVPPIRPRRLVAMPSPGWRSYLATALLIAAIVVAGLATIWRFNGPFGEGDDNMANQPGIAGSATSEQDPPIRLGAQELTPLDASPAADSAACDLSRDIPVVTDATTLPWDRTVAVLDAGVLSLHCDGTTSVIAEGIGGISSTYWPGAVLLTMEDGSLRGVNLVTGTAGELAPAGSYPETFIPEPMVNGMPGSQWMLIAGNPEMTDWRIIDLETMDSMLLSEEIGGVLPTPVMASLNTTGDTAAVITFPGEPSDQQSERAPETPSSTASPHNEATLPSSNAALVIVDSLENRRWTEASSVSEMPVSISHDDSLLALAVSADRGMTVRVERLPDGELIAETGIDYGAGDAFFVLDDGAGLLHLTNERLDLVTWNPERATETLLEFEPAQGLPTMALTADPDVVVVSTLNSLLKGRSYLVDTAKHEVTEIPHVIHRSLSLEASEGRPPRHVIVAAPHGEEGDEATLQLIDVTTSEPVVTSDPIPMEPAQLQQSLSLVTAHGTVGMSFYLPGHAIVLDAATGESFEFEVPAGVEGVPNNHWWHVYPSSDGTIFLTSPDFEPASPRFIRKLTPDASWIELSPRAPDVIVRGAGEGPEASPAETPASAATSEQVPIAPVSTSVEASPATPVTEKIACDVTRDISIATGLDELPWSDTTLLLNDGTLSLYCDGANTVFAEGVVEAQSATWPGAVLLKMEDGSLRGINLITGATGDLGPASLLQSATVGPRSRWLGFPANEQQTDWRFVDLEAMESLLLSEELGGVLPRPIVAQTYAWTPDAVVIGFPGSPVDVRAPSANPLDRDAATPPPAGTPVSALPSDNAALVIDGSLDNRRWVETSRPSFVTAAISPDGELLAITQTADTGMTIRIERLSTGEMVAETGIDYGGGDSMVVLNDGAGLLHLAEDRLDLVTWDGRGEVTVETLLEFEAPQDVPLLALTADPNIAIVGVDAPSGGSMGYLINATTGETTEIPGMLQAPIARAPHNDGVPPRHVLAAEPAGADEARSVFQMIDVSTGEVAVASKPVDLPRDEAERLMAALRDHGTIGMVFLPDGSTVVLDADTGETYTLPPPEPGSEGQWFYFPSPGGDYLIIASRSGGSIFVREMASHGEWIKVSTDSRLSFVPGARAIPEPD